MYFLISSFYPDVFKSTKNCDREILSLKYINITLILSSVSKINGINARGFLFLGKLPLANEDKNLKPG